MIASEVRTVDSASRVRLPREFANATVQIEWISESEVRIRREPAQPGEEAPVFLEESLLPLSNRDRDLFLELLDNPPPPATALLAAVAKHRDRP